MAKPINIENAVNDLFASIATTAFISIFVVLIFGFIIYFLKELIKNWIKSLFSNKEIASDNKKSNSRSEKITGEDIEKNKPYERDLLLSYDELKFYKSLVNVLTEYIILTQVQLIQIIKIKKGFDFYKWFNYINKLSLDFVICDKKSMKVLSVIELDDYTHDNEDAKIKDKIKEMAIKSANIDFLRVRVEDIPSEDYLKTNFNYYLEKLNAKKD